MFGEFLSKGIDRKNKMIYSKRKKKRPVTLAELSMRWNANNRVTNHFSSLAKSKKLG